MARLDPSDNKPKTLQICVETEPPEAAPEPLPRKFERFTLLARVARGGMGEVYLATAQSIEGAERPLIVKIVRPDHETDRSFVARFLDEARIQSQLSHPGVAQILEATTDGAGKPYVVVEYVEGRNLSDVRSRAAQLGVRVSWPEAAALGICLCEALIHVHERTDAAGRPLEIVHRDLSPQNVMIGYGGDLKLIDFGTARGQNRRCQTISGIVFAKPGYVAPEVANNLPGGVPADLYAFGVILWELLAGRRFLTGEAQAHLAAVGAGKRTLPPLARLIGAPAEVDALLSRLTATQIEERYPSARVAMQDIVKLLQRAPSLPDGDRSVRGRLSDLMGRLYPAEPARSRAEFARRVAEAHASDTRLLLPPPSPEPPSAEDPAVLAGTRYRCTREIGRGAMGVVYEAQHVDLRRSVALKVLDTETMTISGRTRFRAEARAIAALDHPHLVKVYDFGSCQDGRLFYAMELLEGESLDRRLARERRLPFTTCIELGIQACRALATAHEAGVIHRDLKPANLFVTRAGQLKVLDFGVAKCGAEEADGPHSEGLSLLGTPEYMAPEQAHGQSDVRSDVYALATVLYELLTGVLPFASDAPLVLLELKGSRLPLRPSSRTTERRISKQLDRVLLRALDPDPERRPASMHHFARELEHVLSNRAPRPVVAQRLGALATGLTLAACIGVLATAVQRSPEFQARLETLQAPAEHALRQTSSWASSLLPKQRASMSSPTRELIAVPADAPPVMAPPVIPASAAPGAPQEGSPAPTAEPSTASTPQAESQPEVTRALAQADSLAAQGRDLRALEVLRRAAARHGDDVHLLRALSKALSKNRSWGDAVRAARRRAELDPSGEARLELARLERANGHKERALGLLDTLVREPDAPPQARELLRAWSGNERVALRD